MAMASLMFTETTNIKKAVQLINGLDSVKFPRLLSRILQKLHLKDERTFNEDEEEKLQDALGLNSEQLELVIATCEFILHQAAYHTAKPNVLGDQLKELNLDQEKVNVVVEAWGKSAKDVLDKLRKQTLAPKQLQDVKWRLCLNMGSSNQAKAKDPIAMFEFGLKNHDTQEKESVQAEFSHEELFQFYNQLETIQGQLDSLS